MLGQILPPLLLLSKLSQNLIFGNLQMIPVSLGPPILGQLYHPQSQLLEQPLLRLIIPVMIILVIFAFKIHLVGIYFKSFQLFVYISFTGPLSDILTDLSSTTSNSTGGAQSVSPNLPSHSPSQASIIILILVFVCLLLCICLFSYLIFAGRPYKSLYIA